MMVGTIEFEEGDEFEHSDYGTVIIHGVLEELDSFAITDTGEQAVFDGGSVDKTSVILENDDGTIFHEPINDFVPEVK